MSNMYPVQVSTNERSIARLTDLYKTAYNEILSQIEGASSFGTANRKSLLVQIQKILKELGAEGYDIIDENLSEAYKNGADQVIAQLQAQNVPLTNISNFNQIHKEAVAALIDDAQKSFAQSLQGVARDAQRVIGQGTREQITQRLALGKIEGSTLKDIKKNIVATIREEGFSALKTKPYTNKNGTVIVRTLQLDDYAETLIRTKTVEARNRGVVNRMVENGYDLVEVSSHGATDACRRWEGKLLSITGDTPGYYTVAQAEDDGLLHPNCKHALNAVAPKLALMTYAYDSSTPTLSREAFEQLSASM